MGKSIWLQEFTDKLFVKIIFPIETTSHDMRLQEHQPSEANVIHLMGEEVCYDYVYHWFNGKCSQVSNLEHLNRFLIYLPLPALTLKYRWGSLPLGRPSRVERRWGDMITQSAEGVGALEYDRGEKQK